MTLVPAYGRDYRSKAEVEADWNADKDFRIASVGRWMGAYVNRRQLVESGDVQSVCIRYRKLGQVVVLKVP